MIVNQKKARTASSDEIKGNHSDAGGFGSCGTPRSFGRFTDQHCKGSARAINKAWGESFVLTLEIFHFLRKKILNVFY